MKTIFALVSLIMVTGAFAQEPEAVGRFQLLTGVLTSIGKVTEDRHIILRIDTKTGKTWVYVAGQISKNGKYEEFWAEVRNAGDVDVR
jgi:RPA family protein